MTAAIMMLAVLCPLAAVSAPPVTAVAFTPDGQELVAGSQSGLQIHAYPALVPLSALPTQLLHIHDVAFSPDGNFLAAAGGTPGEEGVLEVYRWPQRRIAWRARVGDDVLYDVAWRSDSGMVATASLAGTISICEGDGKEINRLSGHSRGVTAVLFLDNQQLLSASLDHTLRLWDIDSGQVMRTFNQHTQPVLDLALRPTGDDDALPVVASAAEDRTVRLWQPTTGRMMRFVRLEKATPLAVHWTGDGQRLLATGTDGHLRVIDASNVDVVHDLQGTAGWAYALALHPAGVAVVVGGQQGQLRVIELP